MRLYPQVFAAAKEKIDTSEFRDLIDLRNESSLEEEMKVEGTIDLFFSDSDMPIREQEVRRYLPQISPFGLILMHDASFASETGPRGRSQAGAGGLISVVLLPTPRGLVVAQKARKAWRYFRHIQWSHMLWNGLRTGHFPPAFGWLPLTTLNQGQYADQHLLFHLLLIPFTWIGDLTLGAKIAAVLFASLSLLSLYWMLLRYRVRYPLLWLLALIGCSWVFVLRLSMTKALGLSVLFLVIGIVLLLGAVKHAWLLPAAFLYVWAYNLFALLAVAAVVWVAIVGWTERRLEWRPLLWTGLGIVAGFVIHPYFPKDAALFLSISSPSPAAWRCPMRDQSGTRLRLGIS